MEEYLVYCVFVCFFVFFVYMVTDFSVAEKGKGEILHACSTTMRTGLLPSW